MVLSDPEDTLTQINTELNKSMVLMEGKQTNKKPKEKSRKSITINTELIHASTPIQESKAVRKSILKKPERAVSEEKVMNTSLTVLNEWQNENNEELEQSKAIRRPHNLEEFMETEELMLNPTEQTYSLNDVNADDELWIVEIPKSVNPHELKGQSFNLGNKTKMKIGQEKYQATSVSSSDCYTCVFGTGKREKPFKVVNLRPSGMITLRRRLASAPKTDLKEDVEEKSMVPFPKGLKARDPLAGVQQNGKIKKKSKSRLKKLDNLE